MKLKEFFEKFATVNLNDINGLNAFSPEHLEMLKGSLMECDEFKNTKKINIVHLPAFLAFEQTGDPVSHDLLLKGVDLKVKTKAVVTATYRLEEDSEFDEIVDLYMITESPAIYNPECVDNLDTGVWKLPTSYNPENFLPKNEIRIIYTPEIFTDSTSNHDLSAEQVYINKIEPKVRELFLNSKNETNIQGLKPLLIRCSPRSIKVKEQV